MRVVYRKLLDGMVRYDLDDTFIIIEVEKEITGEGAHTSSVLVSTIDRMPQSDSEYLAQCDAGKSAFCSSAVGRECGYTDLS